MFIVSVRRRRSGSEAKTKVKTVFSKRIEGTSIDDVLYYCNNDTQSSPKKKKKRKLA